MSGSDVTNDGVTKEFWRVVNKFESEPQRLAFVHPTAKLGRNVKIWQHASILQDVVLEEDVQIGAGAEIGRGTRIGKGSRVGHGVFLPPNSQIGENVFIGPSVTFTDDKNPVCNNANYLAQPPIVHEWASIGAGAVILPGITIGKGALVGAGSVVTHDVPEGAIVKGNPARIYTKEIQT